MVDLRSEQSQDERSLQVRSVIDDNEVICLLFTPANFLIY